MVRAQAALGGSLYFIHFTSADERYDDIEGVELADDAAACEYAILDARYLMDEGVADRSDWPRWKVEVVDGFGRRLLALSFSELANAPRRTR